jgi:diguanylate cyclase (GGDEF)-like protein
MTLFSWIDNRTLIGCQILMASVFAIVFLGMKYTYPRLRGARSFSLAYVTGIVSCGLFIGRGHIPDFFSVVVANFLILVGFSLFYCGIIRFFQLQRNTYPLWSTVAAATLLLAYFTLVKNEVVPRIVISECAIFPIRLLIAVELFRHSSGHPLRSVFGTLMSLYAVMGVARVPLTLLHGAPNNFMQQDLIQTSVLALNVIFVCVIGLCFLLMLSGELMEALETQSFQDPVSGALNRRGIEQKLTMELGLAKRSRLAPSLALIDIDHFKTINDTRGHAAGDDALRQVAKVISSHLRDYDYLGRFGGDEFLLILPEASYQDALKVVERIQKAIREMPARFDHAITLSIGVTQAVPFEPVDTILARADTALYKAKQAGRDRSHALPPTEAVAIPAIVASTHPQN